MTTWHDVLTGGAFRSWLHELAKGSKVPTGARLDPFATSLRRSGMIPEHLTRIEKGLECLSNDPAQTLTDLTQIGVITKDDTGGVLTPLGLAALSGWRAISADDDKEANEIARCIILVREGNRLRMGQYIDMCHLWDEIRRLYDVDKLFQKPHGLYLLSYLNQTLAGYNPWNVVKSARWEVPESEALDWEGLLQNLPGADVKKATETLAKRVKDSGSRGTGRLAFCKAMELVAQDVPSAIKTLERWRSAGHLDHVAKASATAALQHDNDAAADAPHWRQLEDLIHDRHNVVLYGPPGTGKTRAAFAVADRWERREGAGTVFRVTFHPSYSYEDFVQGFRPDPKEPAQYRLQDGVLLRACSTAERLANEAEATATEAAHVLLVIDEINRGDTARIFGELITFIEGDKRGIRFGTAQEPTRERVIPLNLYLLGTMNTADRSVSLMDVALRRRFAFVGFAPIPEALGPDASWLSAIEGVDLPALLRGLNLCLESEGVEVDRAIGHALLGIPVSATSPLQALRRRFEVDVIPLVAEYCTLDRRGVRRVLGDLVDERGLPMKLGDDEFLAALKAIAAKA